MLATEPQLPPTDFAKILNQAEATRFTSYMFDRILACKTKADLRDVTVKEMKSCRNKIGKDMPGVPKAMQTKCHEILWAA